ncbi:hypothetical protein [Marispirochaeta sp.]|uniref:hypothetical protein n=1 Tax=Marispirochaeta sp. TaxID=2038653 RepID=UPI0029C98B8D|nr:hypothetical protein [Marispirochaeta sp.]
MAIACRASLLMRLVIVVGETFRMRAVSRIPEEVKRWEKIVRQGSFLFAKKSMLKVWEEKPAPQCLQWKRWIFPKRRDW